ncbi:MAG: hypothetical protein KC620_18335 [Myxococcales bacterium]|nr:hypothetical protein [Myxococcales bacterium]
MGLALAALWGCGGGPDRQGPPVKLFECPRDQNIADSVAKRIGEQLRAEDARMPAEEEGVERRKRPLDQVWDVLDNEKTFACWDAALRVSGFVGTEVAFARIRGFIEHRAHEYALGEEQFVLQHAFTAIGNIVLEGHEPATAEQALGYLLTASRPLSWVKRSARWPIDAVLRRELIRTLTRAAVEALAQTGRPEAFAELRTLAIDAVDRRTLRFKYQTGGGPADRVDELVNLHVLPPGRVAFAMEVTLSHIRDAEFDTLRPVVERVRDQAVKTFEGEQAWLAALRGARSYVYALRAADQIADSRLSGFHGQLDSLRHLMDGHQAQAAIEKIAALVFPEGPLEVINREYAAQIEHVLTVMQKLEDEYADELDLLNLREHVGVVREAHLALRRALESGQKGAGFDRVLEDRARLQWELRVLVAQVIARFPSDKAKERGQRSLVLGAVLDQNDQIDKFLLRNEPISDVNPKSGQELAPVEQGGGVDEAEATEGR